jgi:hypothetical protein
VNSRQKLAKAWVGARRCGKGVIEKGVHAHGRRHLAGAWRQRIARVPPGLDAARPRAPKTADEHLARFLTVIRGGFDSGQSLGPVTSCRRKERSWRILPDFFWPETNQQHGPVRGIAPPPWFKESALAFMDHAANRTMTASKSSRTSFGSVHIASDQRQYSF